MKFRKPIKPKWLKKITDNMKSCLDSLEKSINDEFECPKYGYNITEYPVTEFSNPYLNYLNLLSDKVHNNAINKGFYDCKVCKGTGKDEFNTMGTGDGECGHCSGTGKDKNKNFGELLMLITSELGEALEADRKDKRANVEAFKSGCKLDNGSFERSLFKTHIKDTVEDEIADSLIRILDLCGYYNIDIDWHVEQKMKYNATREARHGKKY